MLRFLCALRSGEGLRDAVGRPMVLGGLRCGQGPHGSRDCIAVDSRQSNIDECDLEFSIRKEQIQTRPDMGWLVGPILVCGQVRSPRGIDLCLCRGRCRIGDERSLPKRGLSYES